MTDEALVAAFVAGDEHAFDELVRRYTRRVYGICWKYFRDETDAEDAAQETFVVLLRRAGTFRGGAAFSTWLYRVATNACHDIARRKARRPVPTDLTDAVHDEADPDDVLARRELGVDLLQALSVLEPAQREAVVLHDVSGLPYADVAERQGVAVGTVKSRIARAHARLAQLLGASEHGHVLDENVEPFGQPLPPTSTP